MSLSKVPLIRPSKANRPRNAFDLSQRHLFTAPAGALLPVLSLDLMPHDHIEINASDFMRTLPMNSAAFVSMRGVYEFFFVPYKQLWSGFDQFITGMSDYKTSYMYSFKNKVLENCPNFSIQDFVKFINAKADKDIHGFPKKNGVFRMLDLLGYGKYSNSSGTAYTDIPEKTTKDLGNVTPFRALAYQKIYSDHYSNSTYEDFQIESFNADFFGQSGKMKAVVSNEPWDYDWFTMRYRNAGKDIYTNLRPTPLFSVENFGNGLAPGALGVSVSSDKFNTEIDIVNNSGSLNLSVNDIRNAFALDKLASITMRAGKTYKEQIEAHFGISVDEGRDGKCEYLGGFDSNMQVGDVTQTSGTTTTGPKDTKFGGYLGRTTGKATGSGNGQIKYDAREHGILMCIYSIVPDVQYDATKIDPFVQKIQRGDFFIPEFEDLGMQPLFCKNISWKYAQGNLNSPTGSKSPAFGWQPRYSEYKTALDTNHGQFANGEPLSFWSIGRARANDFLHTFNISSLKINPHWLDSVFAVDYNGTELTDQFYGECYFNILKVSDMTVDGMPRV